MTARGRVFLAGGATIVLCAVILGQGALLRIGILVVALPAIAWLLVGRHRHHVTTARMVAQPVVAAGTRCDVELVVTARRHGATVLGEEQLPFALGDRPRFVLEGRSVEQRVRYAIRSDVRGRFQLGPLTTRTTDPFGLMEVRRTNPGTASIIVTPPIVPLPTISLGSGRGGSDDQRSPSVSAGSAEDVTVREYRQGDDLRRVHWRSSARVGELMVRREEHPWEARATVLLDNRASAHRGRGRGSSLEAAVNAAASVAVHLDRHGYAVRLLTADGSSSSDTESIAPVLEHLALVAASARTALPVAGSSGHGAVVGVFGVLEPGDAGMLRALQRYAGTTLAIALDAWQWEHRNAAPSDASAQALRELRWRAVTLGVHDRLEDAWRALAARQDVRR